MTVTLSTAIVPARAELNAQGIPMSPFFDDVYHAADGGLGQAQHVFIGGNDLPRRWQRRQQFTILETGFGLGLNFLSTWDAWRRDPQRSQRLHFVSVELHPFPAMDLAQLHQRWPQLAELSAELLANWPPLTPGCHRLLLDGGRVSLTLFFGDAQVLLPRMAVRADALYLDGFAPAKNPELWQPKLFRALSQRCAPGATLATWSLAAQVKRDLSTAGWLLTPKPGFGRRREMLTGHLPASAELPPASPGQAQRALIIGAGVAGCAMAERLAARGWQVHILERQPAPAMEASGNPAGLMHPALAKDDNIMARITRAGMLYAARLFTALARENPGLEWHPSGVLQLARDQEQDEQQRLTIEALGFPPDYARYVDAAEASALAGAPMDHGAWHYPGSGWLSPPTLCHALLARWPQQISVSYNSAVAALRREGDQWLAFDSAGQMLGQAPQLILASAFDTQQLFPGLPLTQVRGQISFIPSATIPDFKLPLCGNGYLTPPLNDQHCCGATYNLRDDDPQPRASSHVTNLEHLQALLPETDMTAFDPEQMQGRVGFRTTAPDRLPMVGALPDQENFVFQPLRREAQLGEVCRHPGLHCLIALGSRGMVWAPLAAELLAAKLCDEPLPLERELVDALDPARFLLRAQRKTAAP